jgi:ABC-2 type transport system permease protein
MSPKRTILTTFRVLKQLRHDPRTMALIFLVPCLLIVLLKYVFHGQANVFNRIAPMALSIVPLVELFLVASIATLRERTVGTLDRLMSMPLSKLDFVLGYALAFSLIAFIQACLTSWVVFDLLGVPVAAGPVPVLAAAVLAAVLGMALGLFVSAFAATEFQAVQFLPAFIFPQVFTCGLFVPREQMARPLQWFADVMPVTYSVDALKQTSLYSGWNATLWRDFVVVIIYALAVLVLGAATIRRHD